MDYQDTFSPVLKPTTIILVLSLVVSRGWHHRQIGISNVFLYGLLNEEVYMQQQLNFENPQYPTFVCKMNKEPYGLKQSPRAWFSRLSAKLHHLGFSPSKVDTSFFVFHAVNVSIYMLVYVDDIVIVGSSQLAIDQLIRALSSLFPLRDLSRLNYFL